MTLSSEDKNKIAAKLQEMVRHEKHLELGGSSANYWANCYGSIFLKRQMPKEPTGEAAQEGTVCHSLAEICARDFLDHKIEGTDPEANYKKIKHEYPEIMQEAAEGYREIIWKKVLEESVTNKAFGFEELFALDIDLQMGGILDFWAVYVDDRGKRTGVVLDFKFGFVEVDPKKTAQLPLYACGLRKWIREQGKDLDRVRLIVYQPKLAEEYAYKEVSLTGKQLDAWDKKFYKAAYAIYVDKKPKFKVGDWCRWCPGQSKCPKFRGEVDKALALKLVDINTEVLPAVEMIEDAKIIQFLEMLPYAVKLGKKMKEYVINRHLNGAPLAGRKVILVQGRRAWLENHAEIGMELKAIGVAEPFIQKLKGITAIESITGKGVIDKWTKKGQSLKIVEESDPRPAITNLVGLLDDNEED